MLDELQSCQGSQRTVATFGLTEQSVISVTNIFQNIVVESQRSELGAALEDLFGSCFGHDSLQCCGESQSGQRLVVLESQVFHLGDNSSLQVHAGQVVEVSQTSTEIIHGSGQCQSCERLVLRACCFANKRIIAQVINDSFAQVEICHHIVTKAVFTKSLQSYGLGGIDAVQGKAMVQTIISDLGQGSRKSNALQSGVSILEQLLQRFKLCVGQIKRLNRSSCKSTSTNFLDVATLSEHDALNFIKACKSICLDFVYGELNNTFKGSRPNLALYIQCDVVQDRNFCNIGITDCPVCRTHRDRTCFC